jgi:DNA-binding Xre family transcriptional regulator
MVAHHLWKATQLAPLLHERGVNLSSSQVRRLVARKPERLSMTVLMALCDIFGCTPSDLITPYAFPGAEPGSTGGEDSGARGLTTGMRRGGLRPGPGGQGWARAKLRLETVLTAPAEPNYIAGAVAARRPTVRGSARHRKRCTVVIMGVVAV